MELFKKIEDKQIGRIEGRKLLAKKMSYADRKKLLPSLEKIGTGKISLKKLEEAAKEHGVGIRKRFKQAAADRYAFDKKGDRPLSFQEKRANEKDRRKRIRSGIMGAKLAAKGEELRPIAIAKKFEARRSGNEEGIKSSALGGTHHTANELGLVKKAVKKGFAMGGSSSGQYKKLNLTSKGTGKGIPSGPSIKLSA